MSAHFILWLRGGCCCRLNLRASLLSKISIFFPSCVGINPGDSTHAQPYFSLTTPLPTTHPWNRTDDGSTGVIVTPSDPIHGYQKPPTLCGRRSEFLPLQQNPNSRRIESPILHGRSGPYKFYSWKIGVNLQVEGAVEGEGIVILPGAIPFLAGAQAGTLRLWIGLLDFGKLWPSSGT